METVQTYRLEEEQWEAAYTDLRTEFVTTTGEMKAGLKDLENQLNNERSAWKAEVRRAKWGWVLPVIVAGAAGYMAGR